MAPLTPLNSSVGFTPSITRTNSAYRSAPYTISTRSSASSVWSSTNTISGWDIWCQFFPWYPSLVYAPESSWAMLYVRPTTHGNPSAGSAMSTSDTTGVPVARSMTPESIRPPFQPMSLLGLPASEAPSSPPPRDEPSMYVPRCSTLGLTNWIAVADTGEAVRLASWICSTSGS